MGKEYKGISKGVAMYNRYQKKLSAHQIQQMRTLVEKGFAIHYIARKFNCRANAVWFHVFDLIPPKKLSQKQKLRIFRKSKLIVSDVIKIRKMGVVEKLPATIIARKFDISNTAALSIIKGRTFRWIPGETLSGEMIPIDYEYKVKTDLTRGAKKGSKKKVKAGVLKKYAAIYGVAPTTVYRWIKLKKLKIKKYEMIGN